MEIPKRNIDVKLATVAAVVAAFIVLLVCIVTLSIGYNSESVKRGTFGDMFGAANALFSGMAFVGVVYAIMLQRIEVSISKDELDRTKKFLRIKKDLCQRKILMLKIQNLRILSLICFLLMSKSSNLSI